MNALRKGMWVRHGDKVGIIAEFGPVAGEDGTFVAGAEVHYVDEKGHTTKQALAPLTSLTQSAFDDIPKPRRPSEKAGRQLGYLRA